MQTEVTVKTEATGAVARYIAESRQRVPSAETAETVKHHILDAFLAIISGSQLTPGRLSRKYVESYGAKGICSIIGSPEQTRPELAALANGMSAHADETDDVNDLARTHPGASAVPAAIALGEAEERTGTDLLRAVLTGYNVGSVISVTAWTSVAAMQKSIRSPHGVGQTFGAAAAAAALTDLSPQQIGYVLAYATQQSSGLTSFYRDQRHVEKAFASSGMQAHAGVRAVEFVKAGFTGVADILDGQPGLFDAFGDRGSNDGLLDRLAEDLNYASLTDLKRFPSGMPTQAALECAQHLLRQHKFAAGEIEKVTIRLPTHGAKVVGNRTMPDIDVRYVVAVMLTDGDLSFENSHDYERRKSASLTNLRDRVELMPDASLDGTIDGMFSTRRAAVEIRLKDGRVLQHRVLASFGSRLRPLGWDEMVLKSHRILGWCAKAGRIDAFVEMIRGLENVKRVADLTAAASSLLDK